MPLVEEHRIDAAPDGGLSPSDETAHGVHVAGGAGTKLDGDVSIAPGVRGAPRAGAEEDGVGDVGFVFEDVTEPGQHATRLTRGMDAPGSRYHAILTDGGWRGID